MLKLKNVSKYYYQDGVIAPGITKINLELHLGEFVVITGESGSGKSTLLNVLSGLDTYEDGEMFINGEETSHYTETDYLEYRRKYVSNIFQNFNLVNSYTVYENIELSLIMNGKKKSECKKVVNDLIKKVGMSKYKRTKVSHLSGGQKQRVAIARALANDTPIIVADEPTGALDSTSSKEILELLHSISEEKLVIVVTHNKEEIEKYATRLIKMHDTRILEDKVVKKVNLDKDVTINEIKDIRLSNKIKLGIKNAFNIPVKTILMFIIFMLITITLISSYAILAASEDETSDYSYNYYFNSSDSRIIVKKDDNSLMTDEDYGSIRSIEGVSEVIENDLLLDFFIDIDSTDGYFYFYGYMSNDSLTYVDEGRMPTDDYEIVLAGNKDDWFFSDIDNVLNKDYILYIGNDEVSVKVVGIIYNDDIDYDYHFYLSETLKDTLSKYLYEIYSEVTYTIGDISNFSFDIIINNDLADDTVYLSDTLNTYCKYSSCLNKTITLNLNNIYETSTYDLTVAKVYNQYNSKTLLGKNYADTYEEVYMNETTYDKIFNTGNYQSSVIVNSLKDVDEVESALNSMGYTTLALKYAKGDTSGYEQIIKIFKLVATIILVATLFFISYVIIKIIYKSRNSYYATLRTLGCTKKVCTNILMYEFLTLITFTYIVFIILMILIYKDIIVFDYLKDLTNYVSMFDYVLVYFILIVLGILITNRYSKKIFEKSIIKTYGERI